MICSLETDISELLIFGIQAQNSKHEHFHKLSDFLKKFKLGGIVLFRYNIETPKQTQQLIADLQTASSTPLLIAVDQEGGKVQRFTAAKGFADHKSAHTVASKMNFAEAYQHYLQMAQMLKLAGVNFNLAPCVDLDCNPPCSVIGGMERSFGSDIETVVSYSAEFIKAHRDSGLLTTLKHFPGHGHAQSDTHKGLVDITNTWSPVELEPYKRLSEQGLVDSVMLAHVIHNDMDSDTPASLSKVWIDKIRNGIGFDGLVLSDCLHMGAIITDHDLEQTVIKGLNAGLDLLLFSNNPMAAGSILTDGKYLSASGNSGHIPDPDLPEKFRTIVLRGLDRGLLSEAALIRSIERVKLAKSALK